MSHYHFELTDFALSDSGIHLLRNRYNYKTIHYNDLDKALIRKGAEMKNAPVSFIFGIALLSFSVLKSISLFQDFNNPTMYHIYIESILLPLFPGLAGIYLIYAAFKRGTILQLEQGRTRYKLRLKEAEKSGQSENLKVYLKKRLLNKLICEDGYTID